MFAVRLRRFTRLVTQRSRFSRPAVDRRQSAYRLRLELLEDRLAPATHTWTGMTNNLWSVASNWTGGSPAGDALAALDFPARAKNLVSTNDLDNLVIRSIRFSANEAYTISGNALILNGGGINLTSSVQSVTDTITLNIILGSNQIWRTTKAGAVLDVGGVVSGNHRLSKAGAGTLILEAANDYNGTTLNGGTLTVGTSQSLGSGKLTLHGGIIASSTSLTLANELTVTGNSSVGGSHDLAFTGAGTLSKGITLTVANTGTTTLAGKLSGNGTVAVAAASGTVVLAGDNSQAATTLISGTLVVVTNTALGTGELTLQGGSLEAGADVTLANNFAVTGSATLGGSNNLTWSGSGTLAAGTTLTVVTGGMVVLSGNLDGAGGLSMAGTGTLVLGGNNSFTGTTVVAAGTLLINGTEAASPVTVGTGATLAGTGVVGAITAAGSISPGGPGAGLLQSNGAVFSPGSALLIKLNGTNAGTDYDQLNVNGTVDLSGSPVLSTAVGFASSSGDMFTIVASTGGITGTFAGLPDGATFTADGITLQINYSATTVVLTTLASPLPPPRSPSGYEQGLGTRPGEAVHDPALAPGSRGEGRLVAAIPLQPDAGRAGSPTGLPATVSRCLKTAVLGCCSATEELQPSLRCD